MARKKQSEKGQEPNVIDLGQKIGLTLLTDATSSEISDWLPTGIPHLDYVIGGGIPFGRVI